LNCVLILTKREIMDAHRADTLDNRRNFHIISHHIIWWHSTVNLEQKYQALLDEAQRRRLPDVDGIQLCFQTLSLASAIDRDCAALLAPHGLSEGRFVLLFLLDAAPDGLAPNVLAEQAGVTRATVTGLLDGLEREELIERLADAVDRRALRISLTRKGKRVAKKVFDQHGRWIASLFGNLSPPERAQLAVMLDKVASNLMEKAS
jgi:MarR family transcriptional regulator, negative regulator of the multidrug operon emrRAB